MSSNLKPCTTCGHQISRAADKCPSCGAPNAEALLGQLVAYIIAAVFMGLFMWYVLQGLRTRLAY